MINCASRHTLIAYVEEDVSNSPTGAGAWDAAQNHTTFTNSYGFPNQILEANVGCQRGRYVRTDEGVYVDGTWSGWYYTTPWVQDVTGC